MFGATLRGEKMHAPAAAQEKAQSSFDFEKLGMEISHPARSSLRRWPRVEVRPAPPRASRSSTASGPAGVVDRAEAAMDVVVDHADVLHERVNARGPDEAV